MRYSSLFTLLCLVTVVGATAAGPEMTRTEPGRLDLCWDLSDRNGPAPAPVLLALPHRGELVVESQGAEWEPCLAPPMGPELQPAGPPVRIINEGIARGIRIATLGVSPYAQGADGAWRRAGQITARLTLPESPETAPARLDRLQASIAGLLLNPEDVPFLLSRPEPPPPSAPSGDRDGWAYKALVNRSGVYRPGPGLDLTGVDPRKMRLEVAGRQAPLWILGEEDGQFDPGDRILFLGDRYVPDLEEPHEEAKYTEHQVYWLSESTSDGMRFQERSAPPVPGTAVDRYPFRLHDERNDQPNWPADKFIWDLVLAGETKDFQIQVPDVHPDSEPATLRLALWGYTSLLDVDPDHHFIIWFNGRQVLDTTFDGWELYTAEIQLQPGELHSGANTIRISCPGDTGAGEVDGLALDWIQVDFERIIRLKDGLLIWQTPEVTSPGTVNFRVTGLTSPDVHVLDQTARQRLTDLEVNDVGGGSYALRFSLPLEPGEPHDLAVFQEGAWSEPDSGEYDEASDWADSSHGADLIVITHPLFIQTLQPYVNHLRGRGTRVEVVKIQDVFDEFAGGVYDPPAIQEMVRHAYRHWQPPAPEALLLVGDATWDYKGYMASGVNQDFVPAFSKSFTQGSQSGHDPETGKLDPRRSPLAYDPSEFTYGEAMVDNQFVSVDGSDNLPDLMLARWPVTTQAETQVAVNKVLAQAVAQPVGPWRRRMTFITGGVDETEQELFLGQTQMLLDRFVQPSWNGFEVTRIDKDTPGYGWGQYEADVIAAFNRGQAMVNFFGHAGTWSWEAVFDFDDIQDLANQGRLPLVTSMTCNTLRFANPEVQSFGEEFFLTPSPDIGAGGIWGGYNFGDFWSDYYLSYSFLEECLNLGQGRIGSAIMLAMIQTLSAYPWYAVITEPYTFIGDPYGEFAWGAEGAPQLWVGGYWSTRLSSSGGGGLSMLAYVSDPDGPFDVQRVELTLDGIPTGVLLMDDGTVGDAGFRDGFYGLQVPVDGAGLVPAGQYKIGLQAWDMGGHAATVSWPDLVVGE